jgi:predicted porin
MKKTIIAASIAAVMSAPAMAELTVYGKVHMGVSSSTENVAFTTTDAATDAFGSGSTAQELNEFETAFNAKNADRAMNDNSSRIGFKASEDVGNGMKVFAQIEYGTTPTTATTTLSARDSFVGLSGDFGTIKMGNMAAPTKATLYKIGNIHDADVNNGYDAASAFESKGDRIANQLQYSNSFNGVNVAIAGISTDTEFNASHAMSIDYTLNGLTLAAASKDIDGANGEEITLFGAKYTMGDLTVGIANEQTDGKTSLFGVADMLVASEGESDITMVSASYTMGNNVLGVSYSDSDHTIVTGDTDGDYEGTLTGKTTNISLTHKLSKSASVYVAYTSQDISGTLYDDDDTAEPQTIAGGRDMTSVGISYSF